MLKNTDQIVYSLELSKDKTLIFLELLDLINYLKSERFTWGIISNLNLVFTHGSLESSGIYRVKCSGDPFVCIIRRLYVSKWVHDTDMP